MSPWRVRSGRAGPPSPGPTRYEKLFQFVARRTNAANNASPAQRMVGRAVGKAMKILWLNHRDIQNPTAGGAERTIHEVARRLVARGHEVTVLTTGWPGSPREEWVEGVRIVRFPGSLGPHLALPIFLRRNPKPDAIVDDMAHAIPWGSPWFARVSGTVFFRHLHRRTLPGQVGPMTARVLAAVERQYPRIYPSSTFVTESETSAADLITLGIPKNRILRIPPGVDTETFSPRPKCRDPTLVYFGGLRRYKRPEHALIVQQRLRAEGLASRLVVVGSGPMLDDLKKDARKLGLEGSVDFRGRLSVPELSRVVTESWVNVHCSASEGWGYSIMEAAAAGTPTAAYDVPGVSEAVVHGETGLLVPDGDTAKLAEATRSLLTTQAEWPARCRRWASRFSWDDTAGQWEAHLRRVASLPRRSDRFPSPEG